MAFYELTGAMCRRAAASLRESLSALAVNVPPSSDLGSMLRDLDTMGTAPGLVLHPETPEGVKRDLFEKFMRFEQANRLAGALARCRSLPGVERKARALRKQLDRLRDQDSPAQDTLFEFEIAARLSLASSGVRFDEPDLVLDSPGFGPLVFAVKRVRNTEKLARRLVEARDQIHRCGHPGIIVVSVEPILHFMTPAGRPGIYGAETREEFSEAANDAVRSVAAACGRTLAQSMSTSVAGVFICAMMTGFVLRPASYTYKWVVHAAVNERLPGADAVISAVGLAMSQVPLD